MTFMTDHAVFMLYLVAVIIHLLGVIRIYRHMIKSAKEQNGIPNPAMVASLKMTYLFRAVVSVILAFFIFFTEHWYNMLSFGYPFVQGVIAFIGAFIMFNVMLFLSFLLVRQWIPKYLKGQAEKDMKDKISGLKDD